LALLIALLLSPLLSRFFSPEQFGYLAVYASLAAIGSVFASLRFELTIVLAPTDRYAYYLLLLAFGLTAIFSAGFIVLSGIVVMAIPDLIARHIPPFVIFPMLTVGIFLTTANLILTSWGTRRKRYKGISQARVIQALTLCSGQVALGALSLSGFGLILGHALGAACMMLKLLQEYADEFRRFWRTASLKRVVAVAKRYKDFPRFMVIGQLANVVSGQAPVILLAFLYDSHAVGLYSLPER
ncbi:oligosaccharide flippase family protein, partial [Pseudomonas aeruginosa]